MAQTTASVFGAAITFALQRETLKNLRAALVFGDKSVADQGTFDSGTDTITFLNVPDLPINVTTLTEGTPPTKRALSITTVSISSAQYGDLLSITDLAKVKAPIEVVRIGAERLARQAQESLDQVSRDVIALGGTVAYHTGAAAGTRVDIAAGDLMTASELRRLNTKMKKSKIPQFGDGYYRAWVHPNVAYDLKNDTTTGGFIDVTSWRRNFENSVDALAA